MRKVAVFGNAGAGKSTLARKLADATGLPLYSIDMIQFTAAGEVPRDVYLNAHAQLMKLDAWIIDGYGCRKTAWERFACADTLVYLDLPLFTHFSRITKRLLMGVLRTPEGWPEGSPMISSTMSSYRVLWSCHRHLTPDYRKLIAEARRDKRVHHLRSAAEMDAFVAAAQCEARGV